MPGAHELAQSFGCCQPECGRVQPAEGVGHHVDGCKIEPIQHLAQEDAG